MSCKHGFQYFKWTGGDDGKNICLACELVAKEDEISHLQKSFNHTAVLLQESEAEISLLREALIKIFMRTDNEEILKIIHKVREAK